MISPKNFIVGAALTALIGLTGCAKERSQSSSAANTPAISSPADSSEKTDEKSSSAADAVYGTWKFPTMTKNGINFDMTITIAQDSLTSTVVCTLPTGEKSQASVSAKSKLTDSSLESLEDALAISVGEQNCKASIRPGIINYVLNGDTLTLSSTDPNEKSVDLTRVQK